jgi:hypothetical protein
MDYVKKEYGKNLRRDQQDKRDRLEIPKFTIKNYPVILSKKDFLIKSLINRKNAVNAYNFLQNFY